MPKRVQMHRRKGGWRDNHPDAVIVARPSMWGNPWKVGTVLFPDENGRQIVSENPCPHADSIEAIVSLHESWIEGRGLGGLPANLTHIGRYRWRDAMIARRHWLQGHLHELCGKDLACWCPLDQPCHADVLLEIANR